MVVVAAACRKATERPRKGCRKAANGQSGRVMSRTLPHWDTGITRVSPDSCSLQFVPAPRSYPPGTRTRPRSYSRKIGNYSFATRSWLCSYSFATRAWLCSYSFMDELKKLVLVRGRVRARCDFGHVRVREVPVAVAYPKSNSHLNSNSCLALHGPRFLFAQSTEDTAAGLEPATSTLN